MLKRYNLHATAEKPHDGWAVIVIDTDGGFFATVSDWGNYAFAWANPGEEFRKFLLDIQSDYLCGKLMHGRSDSEEYDEERTATALKELLQASQRQAIELKLLTNNLKSTYKKSPAWEKEMT